MEQEQEQAVQAAPEAYPLDDAAIEMIAEIDQQVMSLNTARNAVLSYFAKQHGLQGQWQLSANRKELVKAQQ